MPLTDEQSHAMQVFDRTLRRVEATIFSILFLGGLLLLSIGWIIKSSGVLQGGMVLMLLAGIYPLVLFVIVRIRTGLAWHLTLLHPDLLVDMIIVVLVAGVVFPLMVADSKQVGGLVIIVAFVISPLCRLLLRKGSQQRGDSERDRYGEHWPKLASLSFRDILFLRIPHERA